MQKILEKLIISFREELLSVRRSRGSKFLFVPKNNLTLILKVLAAEVSGNIEQADRILLTGVLSDLADKQVILSKSIDRHIFKLGGFTYYDIYIKTFDNQTYSRGTSTNEMEAYAKALGEVFERFTLKYYNGFEIVNTHFNDPKYSGQILKYSEYPQPTQVQLEKITIFNVDENLDKFNFIKVPDIKSGQEKYILAQALTMNNEFLNDKKSVVFATTNGAGGGYDFMQARSSAILEILHRHYFLNSWYAKQVHQKIRLDNQVLETSTLGKKTVELEKNNFKIHLVNLTESSGVPTVLCILEKLGGWYMGGASKDTLYKACERSLDEAISTYIWACRENMSGGKIYNKKTLDNMPSGFTDFSVSSRVKIAAFANSYFVNNFDQFFISGPLIKLGVEDLYKTHQTKIEEHLPGPIFEYVFKAELLDAYDYEVVKCFASHTQYFPLDEAHTKPIVKAGVDLVFDKINPFP